MPVVVGVSRIASCGLKVEGLGGVVLEGGVLFVVEGGARSWQLG